MTTYNIKKQDGEFVVCNSKGVILSYCDTKTQAEDIKRAQQWDDERHNIMSAYNTQQEIKALHSEFFSEFN